MSLNGLLHCFQKAGLSIVLQHLCQAYLFDLISVFYPWCFVNYVTLIECTVKINQAHHIVATFHTLICKSQIYSISIFFSISIMKHFKEGASFAGLIHLQQQWLRLFTEVFINMHLHNNTPTGDYWCICDLCSSIVEMQQRAWQRQSK